jgi:hypothetical protein
MRAIVILIYSFVLFSCTNQEKVFVLQEGDLLFQDADCGSYCDAIEKVTSGINGANLSHIGVVVYQKDSAFVLEAISKGVVLTPLQTFLNRSLNQNKQPKVIAMRIKAELAHYNSHFKQNYASYLGKSYDSIYQIDNDSYYCSELVYDLFINQKGEHLFELNPMTFIDPEINDFFPEWIKYFHDLNVPIPEGKAGINPGAISLSDALEIVHIYGNPSGYIEQ